MDDSAVANPRPGILATLKKHEQSVKHWTHSCCNIAQVVALVLVGMWTIKTFSHSEAPGLEPHMRADMDIGWKKVAKSGVCQAKLTVKIENTSKQIIRVTAMHVDGWLSSVPMEVFPHFSPEKELESGTHFLNQDFPENYMLGPLMPGAIAYDSFVFQFKDRFPNQVMWKATFKTDPALGYDPEASESDLVCNYK